MINHEYLELFNEGSVRKDIDIVYDADQHISNSDVVSGTFSLNESAFATKELRFGSLVSSQLSVKLYNTVPNLMDKEISVSITLDNMASNPLKIGKYKVLEDKPTTDRLYKQIKAYDGLYEVINKEVVSWYEGLLFPMTLKVFRDSFFGFLGIEQENTTLINDDMVVDKTILANSIPGKQVLSAICELNGAIGRMNRDGKFEYVILDANPTSRITIDNISSKSGSYEDFDCQPISKVQIRQTTDDIGAIVGEDGNTYIMQDNFLVYGKSASDLTTIATNLLSVIEGISYKPFNIKAIYGNPCYEIGDAITVVTKNKTFNSYIFNRTLKGIQAMTDTIKADGVEYYTENLNSVNVQMQQLKRQTNELSRTVDETKSTITSIETVAGNASNLATQASNTANQANQTANNASSKADDVATDLANNYSTTVEMQSQIKQSADSITSTVSKTYATKTEVEDVMDNLDISNTSTGNYITVEDSGSYPLIELYGYGKSEQKSYTGKNLLQNTATSKTSYGVEFVVNDDGSVTATGTATDRNAVLILSTKEELLNVLKSKECIISGCASGGSTSTYYLQYWSNTKRVVDIGNSNTLIVDDEPSSWNIAIVIVSGATVNHTFYPMIRDASITDATYEQYVGGEPSPNPSYPQDIVSVADDGNLVVNTNNKNLLQNTRGTYSTTGVTWTENSDGSITVVGTATSDYCDYYISGSWRGTENILPMDSGSFISSGTRTSNIIQYVVKDKSVLAGTTDGSDFTFTVEDGGINGVLFRVPNGTTVNTTIYPMIRLASIDDDSYVPYKATQATIPLTDSLRGIKVNEGGNYTDETGQQWVCDTLEKYADGSGKLVQRVYHKVFDGTEGFTIYANSAGGNSMGYYNDSKIKIPNADNLNLKCNKLSTYLNLWGVNVNGCMLAKNIYTPFRFRIVGINTVEDMKTQLKSWYDAGEPMEVICELADYIETPLTAEQIAEIEKLQTFNPITHVTTDDIGDIAIRYYNNSANADVVAAQGNRISKAESSITQNAENIELKVDKNGIISSINQSAEEIRIQADKIKLEGTVTANDNFKINNDGSMETIKGKIGGFEIGPYNLHTKGLWIESQTDNKEACIDILGDADIGDTTVKLSPSQGLDVRYMRETDGKMGQVANLSTIVGEGSGGIPVYSGLLKLLTTSTATREQYETITLDGSTGTIIGEKVKTSSGADLDKDKVYYSTITAGAVAQTMSGTVAGWTHYAEITPSYSSLGSVTILDSNIVMLGDDYTQTSYTSTLCRNTALASMVSNGGTIQKIGVFSTSYKTIRVAIRVAYRKN